MLEDLEPEEVTGGRSPVLHGSYPPQFDPAHYQQAHGMQPGQQQQMTPQSQFDQPPLAPSTTIPAAGGSFGADPSDTSLEADPFGLSASM
jgi:hypothetical protein